MSVIIPARNEEKNIARVVRSLAGQENVCEIIVVDDQSQDSTPAILEALRRELPAVQVLRLDALPEGWVGKNYAAARGAALAAGGWLLFTDADTEHAPGCLRTMLERAEADGADLLSLSPRQETPSWWEKAVIPRAFVQLARWFPFDKASDPASPVAAANGQFILIRRETYERAGGHAAVRGDILEDVELAKCVKANGGRLIFLPGGQWVRTRMYGGFSAMWAGWTKNLYLLAGRRAARLIAAAAALWLLDDLPWAALLGGVIAAARGHFAWAAAGMLAGPVIAARAVFYCRQLAALGIARRRATYQPLGSAIFGLLLLNSARAHVLSRAVTWKGRTYSTRKAREAAR